MVVGGFALVIIAFAVFCFLCRQRSPNRPKGTELSSAALSQEPIGPAAWYY
jgi:hypothetical protein